MLKSRSFYPYFYRSLIVVVFFKCTSTELDLNHKENCKKKALESYLIMLLYHTYYTCDPVPARYTSKEKCLSDTMMSESARYTVNNQICHSNFIERLTTVPRK